MREATDEIMCRIAAELPEKYRGFYAEHPRLKELLANKNPMSVTGFLFADMKWIYSFLMSLQN